MTVAPGAFIKIRLGHRPPKRSTGRKVNEGPFRFCSPLQKEAQNDEVQEVRDDDVTPVKSIQNVCARSLVLDRGRGDR